MVAPRPESDLCEEMGENKTGARATHPHFGFIWARQRLRKISATEGLSKERDEAHHKKVKPGAQEIFPSQSWATPLITDPIETIQRAHNM
ncbi:hypothetical protein BPOR_0365g00050 [Botrytis porri]|uniref:Uncharacterized protein n=1 Tax=Botrytis porri TaxID=87229 RepID=A0A4Z1KN67_9HELO|nr:hypothetical protein BPOR_0365g00050 [Botrytis porri]